MNMSLLWSLLRRSYRSLVDRECLRLSSHGF